MEVIKTLPAILKSSVNSAAILFCMRMRPNRKTSRLLVLFAPTLQPR